MSFRHREQPQHHPRNISVSPVKQAKRPTNYTTRPIAFNPYVPVSELYRGTDVPTLISPPSMEQALSGEGGTGTGAGTESVILPTASNSLLLYHYQQQQKHQHQQQQRAAMPASSHPGVARLPAFLTQAATTDDLYNAQVAVFSHLYSKAQMNEAMYYPLQVQPSLPVPPRVASPVAVLHRENQHALPISTFPEAATIQPTNDQVEHPTMNHGGTDAYNTPEGIEYTHVIHPHLGPILDISNFIIQS